MNMFGLVFSIIGIVAIVFLFGNQAFAYGGYGDPYFDPGSPPPYAYCSYADYKSNVASYGDCYPFGY